MQGEVRRQTLYTSLGSLAFRNLMISNYSTEIVRTTALWMLLRKQIVNKGGCKKNLRLGNGRKSQKKFQPGCKGGDGNKACLKQQTYTYIHERR